GAASRRPRSWVAASRPTSFLRSLSRALLATGFVHIRLGADATYHQYVFWADGSCTVSTAKCRAWIGARRFHAARIAARPAPPTRDAAMPSFLSDNIEIAYEVHGEGDPVLLIHGFGSSGKVNWIDTGWVATLTEAGYQAITIDNRGHGASRKLYDPQLYFARDMATDAVRLLDHLGIARAPVIGYSMGARIAAFMALGHPERVSAAVWGGIG